MVYKPERSCFIIGPMKDSDLGENARLRILAKKVLEPIFKDIKDRDGVHYEVRTPYELGRDHIMRDVIYEIDRADIVVADLTLDNPNVYYELGICHSLGRATIIIIEDNDPQSNIQFDMQSYRHRKVHLREPNDENIAKTRDALRSSVEKAHKEASDWTKFENPVIDFYRAPMTYVSPAFALAEGYFRNFLRPATEALIATKSGGYAYDVTVGKSAKSVQGKADEFETVANTTRNKLEFTIVIPRRIQYAKYQYVSKLSGKLLPAIIEGSGRRYSCYYRKSGTKHTLLDAPTTMTGIEHAVERRMQFPNTPRESNAWKAIEQEEIERFKLVLMTLVNQHPDNPAFSNRVKFVDYDPESPGDMLWYHNLMAGQA